MNTISENIRTIDESTLAAIEIPCDWHLMEEDNLPCAANISDALVHCVARRGVVDIEYIANLCGIPCAKVISGLGSAIWQNPDTWHGDVNCGWETADQYLSGPLMPKLSKARMAAQNFPAIFTRNVQALEAIMPHPLETSSIHITLGSPWIPEEIIEQFMNDLFEPYIEKKRVFHDQTNGQWKIIRPSNIRSWFRKTRALSYTYGAKRCSGISLLEKTLNRSEVKDAALREKQKKLEKAFQKWLKNNNEIKENLRNIYNAKYGFIRKRSFDGSFLKFPGMTGEISLFPHQFNAVARILFSGNTLLAHKVGAGKTFTMIAASMELKRLGRSVKNIFIVPNNVVGQWRDSFIQLYPAAKILVVQPKDFSPKKRIETLGKIKHGEFDGIIIAYSCAERIPMSFEYCLHSLERERTDILSHDFNSRDNEIVSALEEDRARRLHKLKKEINQLKANDGIPEEFCFDKLGITGFFLDEAHNYKNIPIDTGLSYVRGINANGSRKCADMLARCQAVQKANGIAVLATGTPICNSITDVYTIQQYLQKSTLGILGIDSFDDWAGNFAEIREVLELDVDGTRFRTVNRFVNFHNLPELSAIFNMVADYADEISWEGVAECKNRDDVRIPNTPELAAYVRTLSERADKIRSSLVQPDKDNMLKVTTDGRKAALDLRLVNIIEPHDNGKAVHCANIVSDIWQQHKDDGSAQVIFCDLSVPKRGFNIYEKLKRLLVHKGIPSNEISFAHDGDSQARRDKLYEDVRNGKVRVIIGSTFKIGLGVNIQDKLIALHHLDVPWRPADMVQREGRILRKGNMHEFVHIFRYIAEGSFDAYCWQVLETKQRFIANFLSGNTGLRDASEMDSHVLSYAEVKALALGDPEIRKRVECATQIEKNVFLQKEWIKEQDNMRLEIVTIREKLPSLGNKIEALEKDRIVARANPAPRDGVQRHELENMILQNLSVGQEGEIEKRLCSYRGFELILCTIPGNPTKSLRIEGNDSIFVELGDGVPGFAAKVDKAINGLGARIKKLREDVKNLKNRILDLEEELLAPDPYAPKLVALNKKLKKIDKNLAEQ